MATWMPAPGDLIGHYRVVRFIARGGMGSVYEAEDTRLGRAVAIKVLVPELSHEPSLRARFADEARVLAGLDSPHIIKLFEHGVHDGQLYLVTQLVRGRDLGEMLREGGAVPLGDALELVGQVASALADAHAAGLLHRDVKPGNVLVLDRGDGDPFAYLIDFGIARAEDSQHTSTGVVVGTVAYMAPERHEGAPASVLTDVYSLGCLLWALLDGQPPYAESRSGVALAMAHLYEPVPVYVGPGPADQINDLLQRSMAKDPAHRFQSAAAARAAIRATARLVPPVAGDVRQSAAAVPSVPSGRPPVSRGPAAPTVAGRRPPDPGPVPLATSSRRNRRKAPLLAALALLLVVGGVAAAVLATADDPPRSGVASDPTSDASTNPGTEASAAEPGGSSAESDPPTPARPDPVEPTLATVFPGAERCPLRVDKVVADKLRVRECRGGDYLVRYSEWSGVESSVSYYDRSGGSQPWVIDGVERGLSWTTTEDSDLPYQWSAAFSDLPFSVSVESAAPAVRQTAIDAVEQRMPPADTFSR